MKLCKYVCLVYVCIQLIKFNRMINQNAMKNYFLSLLIVSLFSSTAYTQGGHFKIRTDDFVQIGYDTYKSLTFGVSTGIPNNGSWAIEQWNNGLNY